MLVFKLGIICFNLLAWSLSPSRAIVFDEVSSLANKNPNNVKSVLFRQIELNWINAPLDSENDYIGLYLDSQPDDNILPVSVHRLNGQTDGHIITDYYLPVIDFYNETKTTEAKLAQTDKMFTPETYKGEFPIQGADFHHHSQHSRPNPRLVAANADLMKEECVGYCLAYHSRNKILAKNCLMTNPNWMHDSFQYISSRSLPSLMIPGTHNSGTYPKHLDKTVLHMINKYQMNQDESIFNQLVYGIRHLDLRVGYSKVKHRNEKLWIYHDIFRTEVSVNEAFDQVKRFLEITSHEIIIMDFHRFTVGFQNENLQTQHDRHAKLIDLIFEQLGQHLVPSYLGHHAPLQEYIAMGKRLIVGYANKATILGSLADHHLFAFDGNSKQQQQVRDIDAPKQDQEDSTGAILAKYESSAADESTFIEQVDRRVGTRIFNKLKTLKLISNSFSKRSIEGGSGKLPAAPSQSLQQLSPSMKLTNNHAGQSQLQNHNNGLENNDYTSASSSSQSNVYNGGDIQSSVARLTLFFPPVRHLWPNKDTIEGLAQYMNDTTCRRYFGELRSMMVELTPTVFGAISDKYDGNRKLAQLVNRPVTDWIRDRWLHCINIVASDFFLGNDLIRLSIYANKMRHLHQNTGLHSQGRCKSFRRIEHLLDKSKIPIQFAYQHSIKSLPSASSQSPPSPVSRVGDGSENQAGDLPFYSNSREMVHHSEFIRHTSSDGNQILLKPLTPSYANGGQSASREKRDSFVENVSDGFINLVSSFKRLLNL